MKSDPDIKPRARTNRLVIQTLSDETLVYDLDRDLAHCLNPTAASVWRRCDGSRTTKQIARSLSADLRQPVEEKVVRLALDQLSRHHLLVEGRLPSRMSALSRREIIRVLATTAVVALPVVASIVAPRPANAVSCGSSGAPCSISADCCTGTCKPDSTCL
jgi:hypothetical protein